MVAMIKRLLNTRQDLHSAAGLLVVTMLLSNILGFLRDLILANTIPLHVLDTYYAAFRLPDFLFNLFVLGAISSAFIPVYLDVKTKKGDAAAWRLAHNLVHIFLVILAGLSVILFFAMPYVAKYFVPGFDDARLALTIPLARILLLSPFFFAVSYVIGGVLNASQKFFAYALAPLVYNLSIIAGAFLSPVFGVEGVAWAVIVGALLHSLVQVPALKNLNYAYQPVIDFSDPSLRRIVKLMIPRSLTLGTTQVLLVAFTAIGSLLPAGAVSIYNLTNNFQTTPIAIFAASIGTAVFPMLSRATSEKNDDEFRSLLTESLKGMFYFIIPSMALLWVLRAHIIRLYLALNHQTWEDTIRAIDTFSWFILALAAQGFVVILIRAFYARHDTLRPMYISMVSTAVTIILAFVFARLFGDVWALSAAFAAGAVLQSLLLFVTFQIAYPKRLAVRSVLETIIVASLVAVAAALAARITLSVVSDGSLINMQGLGTARVGALFTALVSAGAIGGAVYLILSLILKRQELRWLWPKRAARNVILPPTEEIASDEGLA